MGLRSAVRSVLDRSRPASPPLPSQQTVAPRPAPDDVDGPRLNLGCGFDVRDGWTNVDMHATHAPDMVADVTNLAEIPDSGAGYVLAQDILEHIHRVRCGTALGEWNRVLRFGGLLDVRVPDVVAIAELLQRPDRHTPEQQAVLLQSLFGTQSYEGDYHLNGFTELSLTSALGAAGFEIVHLGHVDEWLLDVVAKKVRHCPPDTLLQIDDIPAFVTAAYQRHFGRDPDETERSAHVARITAGTPREALLTELAAANPG